MTVSNLEEWLAVGYVEANDTDEIEATTKDLIADWKELRQRLIDVINFCGLDDVTFREVAKTLHTLRLKP